jgi:hypothetical protein
MAGLCKLGRWSSCVWFVLSWTVHNTAAQLPKEYVAQLPAPVGRITGQINDEQLTTLRGYRHPLATAANNQGEVSADQPLRRILMLLSRSPEQEAALTSLLAAQQDPNSPLFHKWLTPEQYGTLFGPADADVQTITGWLTAHGFTGMVLSKGRTVIEFSGNEGQVKSAFHTAIHKYQVSGTMHFANATDPSIPTALVPAITGIVSLNDFGYRPLAIRGPTLRYAKGQLHPQIVPGPTPEFTVPNPDGISTFYGVAPYDFATIYDLLPLWNAGLDGTAETIAIVGETDINLNDPEQFRAFFGLPVNNPTVVTAGTDPGVQPDETEADLDIEWSGAIAKGAQIEFVTSASTETTQGIDLSALYIIDNNLAPVLSESYGGCELFAGTAGNAFEASLWQQAAAEGITVLVSSGDEGSSDCDVTPSSQNFAAVYPMAVNALASTPYNVAVGGTDFNQYNSWSTYWSANNDPTTKQSVLGYIPEVPWNDSCASTTLDAINGEEPGSGCSDSPLVVTNLNTIATGGGPSSCITSDGSDPTTCAGGWPKPLWQSGVGVPSDGVRDVPDVSLFAGNGVYNSAYVVCQIDVTGGSGCNPTAATQAFLGVGGTSAGTPAMAGVMAIVNQKYGRQGNANVTLYRLAASSVGPSIFHDITTDGNRVACESPDPDCVFPAGDTFPFGETKGHDSSAGYDMVTGLGSIDIANLVNNWSTAAFTPTTTTLTLNGGTGAVTAVHGTSIQAIAGVTASAGNPTGDVSIVGTQPNSSVLLGTLNAGSVSSTVDSLPGGNYTVMARYAGDSRFAPSESGSIGVNISPEPSTTKFSILNCSPSSNTYAPAPASVAYGSLLLLRSDIDGQSGNGVATGSVALSDSGNTLGQFALNAQGFTEYAPNNPLLGGAHSLKASYAGDSSFDASSATGVITVTPAQLSCSLQSNTTFLRPGWVLVLSAGAGLQDWTQVPLVGTMVAPTGTFTFYSGSTAVGGPIAGVGNGGAPLFSGAGQIGYTLPGISPPSQTLQISQLTSVTAPITVSYSGDSNYAPCTSPPLQLTYQTGPIASAAGGSVSQIENILPGTPVNFNIQVGPATAPPIYEPFYPAPTGTVQVILDGANLGSPVTLTTENNVLGLGGYGNFGVAVVVIPTTTLSGGLHYATVTYGGDANYLPSSATGNSVFSIYVPDFTLALSANAWEISAGQTAGPFTATVVPVDGLTGTVSFSCSGLPPGAACIFSPTTATLPGYTSLTITTTQAQALDVRTTVLSRNAAHKRGWLLPAGGIVSACLIVIFVPRCWRKSVALFGVVLIAFSFGVASCGGGSGGTGSTSPSPTTTNVYAFTMTPALGANDTFSVGVSATGGSQPTGTVQFSVDGAVSGAPVALSNGTAQFVTSFATPGKHSVSAAYSGDATYESSTSFPVQVTVPYNVAITATSGTLSHTATLALTVQ